MKPRLTLFFLPVLAGALWLVLDASGRRPRYRPGPAAEGARNGTEEGDSELASIPPGELHAAAPAATAAPRVAPAREPAPVRPRKSEAGISRGRLVDEVTLEPIHEAMVVTAKRSDWTDADGWFDTGEPLDGLDEVLVLNVGTNTNSPEVPRERWQRLAGAWQVPLAIGPTFRLRFSGIEPPRAADWEARLVCTGREQAGWLALRQGPPPYLRYDQPFRTDLGKCWLEARSRDGLFDGRAEVVSLVGTQDVELSCVPRAVLRGRVVDELGAAWGDILIDAFQLSKLGVERLTARTDGDGGYQLSASEPGRMQCVFVPPAAARSRRLQLDVPRGILQAADVVLERRPVAGSIQGRVQGASGGPIECSVRLRALDGSGYEAVQNLSRPKLPLETRTGESGFLFVAFPRNDGQEFCFERLPPGRYEVSAISDRGHACSPGSLVVQSPAEGLVFTFDDAAPLRSYSLELFDADSGAPLAPVHALLRVKGAWSDRYLLPKAGEPLIELVDGVGFEWTVTSPGYRLERGNERDFQPRGELLVAKRALRRGFGLRMHLQDRSAVDDFHDPKKWTIHRRASGVAGAEILADGEPVATSDEDGMVELDLPAEPSGIEVRLAGWRVMDSYSFKNGKLQTSLAAEVWMIRE